MTDIELLLSGGVSTRLLRVSRFKHTDEHRKRVGDKIRGMFADEKHPRAKAVITPVGEFPTLTLAAKALNTSTNTINNRIRTKKAGYCFKGDPVPDGSEVPKLGPRFGYTKKRKCQI
jgi:hypothetical protein